MVKPVLEVVRFQAADVIATSGLLVSTVSASSLVGTGNYVAKGSEMDKGFEDWTGWYDADDTPYLVYFYGGGDWNVRADFDGDCTYIWYESGRGVGNVNFNTHNKSYNYYINNGIALPDSNG